MYVRATYTERKVLFAVSSSPRGKGPSRKEQQRAAARAAAAEQQQQHMAEEPSPTPQEELEAFYHGPIAAPHPRIGVLQFLAADSRIVGE